MIGLYLSPIRDAVSLRSLVVVALGLGSRNPTVRDRDTVREREREREGERILELQIGYFICRFGTIYVVLFLVLSF